MRLKQEHPREAIVLRPAVPPADLAAVDQEGPRAAWFTTKFERGKDQLSRARHLAGDAKGIATGLTRVLSETNDPAKVVARFLEALPIAVPLIDRHSDAVVIGTLGEAGAGLFAGRGVELLYVRAQGDRPARLRVSSLTSGAARADASVNTRTFVHSIYGDADAIAGSTRRVGGEAGISMASVGAFRLKVPKDVSASSPSGWSATLGVGVGVGIPILCKLNAFGVFDQPKVTVFLSEEETARIEALLAGSPDRARLRKLAQRL